MGKNYLKVILTGAGKKESSEVLSYCRDTVETPLTVKAARVLASTRFSSTNHGEKSQAPGHGHMKVPTKLTTRAET